MASIFAIISRLNPSSKVDIITKMRIYNGEEVLQKDATQKVDIKELREEAGREGFSGISTRFIIKAIDNALSESEHNCINPIILIDTLIKSVRASDVSDEEKKKQLTFLQDVVKKEYNRILEKEVTKAFIHGFREQAESLFNNYLDHAEA